MEAEITLQEGLENFHKKNKKYFSTRTMSKEGEKFIIAYDIAHVVFGCDTSIIGEGLVKIWSSLGTTSNFWKVVSGYNEVNAFSLFRKYSLTHVMKNILRYLFVIPKALFRVTIMSKPWPFYNYAPYLEKSISEIRRESIIQILN